MVIITDDDRTVENVLGFNILILLGLSYFTIFNKQQLGQVKKNHMFFVRISIKKRAGRQAVFFVVVVIYYFLLRAFFTHYYLPSGIRCSS